MLSARETEISSTLLLSWSSDLDRVGYIKPNSLENYCEIVICTKTIMSGNDPVPNRVWSSRGSRDSLVKEFGPQAMAEVAAAAEKERQRPALASAASAASAVGCGASKPPLYYRENSLDRDRLFALHLRPQRPLTRANAVAVPKTPDQA